MQIKGALRTIQKRSDRKKNLVNTQGSGGIGGSVKKKIWSNLQKVIPMSRKIALVAFFRWKNDGFSLQFPPGNGSFPCFQCTSKELDGLSLWGVWKPWPYVRVIFLVGSSLDIESKSLLFRLLFLQSKTGDFCLNSGIPAINKILFFFSGGC